MKKYFKIAIIDKIDHKILNQIRVGIVLTVEDYISPKLDTRANIYNHQICKSNNKPGIIIHPLTTKAKNSTVLALVQYFLCPLF